MLWGTKIGAVSVGEGDRAARFEYDRDFLRSGIELSPVVMPLSGQVYTFPSLREESFHGLPGLLADSLPDKFGNAVIDAWLLTQGRPPGSMNAVERLCYTGSRGMGALEYLPYAGPSPDEAGRIEVDRLTELASRVLDSRERLRLSEEEQGMRQIISVGTSAGGARAKAVVAWNEETGEIRSGQIEAGRGFGQWLLKFDGVGNNSDKEAVDGPCFTVIEYAYSLMARAAGIKMTECRLYEEGGRRHFMTRRFDRLPDGGGKLHCQTLGALGHLDFNTPGCCGYEHAALIMRRIGLTQPEIEQLFLRMVFNVLARNQDDHVKNISFLMDKSGRWSLSPAYDVTFAYNPGGLWTGSHQMTVNSKRDRIGLDDIYAAAGKMSLKKARADKLIAAARDSVSRWEEFAGQAGLREELMEAVKKDFVRL